MKKRIFRKICGTVLVIAFVLFNVSIVNNNYKETLSINFQTGSIALAGAEYIPCDQGQVQSPGNGGVYRVYCGVCMGAWIWPNLSGDCRLWYW